jgi:sulfite reductase (NADPH) flavoprotein alpha-component
MPLDTAVAPLSRAKAEQLEPLLEALSPEEMLWLSGYLAGLARPVRPSALAAAQPTPSPTLTILYGSETGHAAALAKRMGELARERGLRSSVVDMAVFRPQSLKETKHLVVITSTHGEGAPPDPAAGFFEFLHSRKAPRLAAMKFAVLGLGDSTYEHFCQAGKEIDETLQALGAERIHPRADCDVDYQDQAAQWTEAVLTAFACETASSTENAIRPVSNVVDVTASLARARGQPSAPLHDQREPFPAPILETLVLNGRGSDKETRHIELSLEGSRLTYEPGDSLAIVSENDPALVSELIEILCLDAAALVRNGASEIPLAEALSRVYEITALTPRFVERYAEVAQSETLRALARPESRADLIAYAGSRQIIDVVAETPVKGLEAARFASMLRKLQPRLYSLASSQAAYPDEAHLAVAVVRYQSHERGRKGVASTYLAERRGLDDLVPVYVERNNNFRLPSDGATPIIMVGAGTGIAPFRAFLQEREAEGAKGETWLFFGDRRFRTDFLYQLEWLRLLKDKSLTRMDVAFSRDQANKYYIQHRLLEQSKDVYAWLEEGAHFYVCGDAAGLGPDVHEALLTVIAREGGMSADFAEEYLKRLQSERRYERDVY